MDQIIFLLFRSMFILSDVLFRLLFGFKDLSFVWLLFKALRIVRFSRFLSQLRLMICSCLKSMHMLFWCICMLCFVCSLSLNSFSSGDSCAHCCCVDCVDIFQPCQSANFRSPPSQWTMVGVWCSLGYLLGHTSQEQSGMRDRNKGQHGDGCRWDQGKLDYEQVVRGAVKNEANMEASVKFAKSGHFDKVIHWQDHSKPEVWGGSWHWQLGWMQGPIPLHWEHSQGFEMENQ